MRQIRNLRIVCFGGGTGLPALLSGLKQNPLLDITAVVTMFDSGGSSGELKDRHGILPPSDFLRCIYALSKYNEEMVREIMVSRLSDNHNAGNIMFLGMADHYGKDYQKAVEALSRVFAVIGKVLPVSFSASALCANFSDKSLATGEVWVDQGIRYGREIKKLFLQPEVECNPLVLQAIRDADVLCVGPGSFYTSILPNFLPQGVKEAIRGSRAPIIFTANLMTEGVGMNKFGVKTFVETLEGYLGRSVARVIANGQVPKLTQEQKDLYEAEGKVPIAYNDFKDNIRLEVADLWTDTLYARHDSRILAAIVSALCHELCYCWRA